MPENSLSLLEQQVVPQLGQQATPTYDEKMSWYMRWFALFVLSIGYVTSIIVGIIGFYTTRDTHFLVFVSPTLFTPAIYYLVPMDNKRFELKKCKIEVPTRRKA